MAVLSQRDHILDHLHHTTTGCDGLPARFLRLTALVYSATVAHLINQSIVQTHFPSQWKTSIIIPIAKIAQPISPADFRPMFFPGFLALDSPVFTQPPMDNLLSDQYAFRNTGSTTAALVSDLQRPTSLLTSEPYVALISLDFTKAFDTVRHSKWARKLALLDIPDEIYNLIVSFLMDRSHITRSGGRLSSIADINASVVQGCGFGPTSFDIVASDLHPLHQCNSIAKYADDTYLLVPASA